MAAEKERYSIIKRLDKGGMAEVFLARSTSLEGFEKKVAIKRVLPHLAANTRFVNMFLDEAKLSLSLEHTNIVSVFDVGRSGDTYFIVMEYIDGTNLKRLIDGHPMPLDIAIYLAIEVCKGLAYAHEKNDAQGRPLKIVHRDISPPNILISREGEVKLVDFGLARAASQIENTDPGVVKGKFAYLSPEAAWGQEVDLRTDIFAVGIVLWEAITGRRLFQGNTDLETLENVRECRVPSIHRMLPNVPASLDRILHRALAKDVADRYQTSRELGRELSHFLVEQRMSVTSYDLAAWIQDVLDLPSDTSRISTTLAESAVQRELERFVGLDEPSVVAQTKPAVADANKFDFEDPRLWGVFDENAGEIDFAAEAKGEPLPRLGTQKVGKPLTDAEAGAAIDQTGMFAPQQAPTTTTSRLHGLPPAMKPGGPGAPPSKKAGGPPGLPPPRPRGGTATARPVGPPGAAAPRTQMMTPLDEAIFEQSGLFRQRDGALISAATSAPPVDIAPPQAPTTSASSGVRRESSGLGRTNTEAVERPVIANEPSGVALMTSAVSRVAAPAPAAPEAHAPVQEPTSMTLPLRQTTAIDIFATVDVAPEAPSVGSADEIPAPIEHSSKPAKAPRAATADIIAMADLDVPTNEVRFPVFSVAVIVASAASIVFLGYQILWPFLSANG